MRFTICARRGYVVVEKVKCITSKTSKGSEGKQDMHKTIASDKNSSSNEKKMALLVKRFTRFFQERRTLLVGQTSDSLSMRNLRSRRKMINLTNNKVEAMSTKLSVSNAKS